MRVALVVRRGDDDDARTHTRRFAPRHVIIIIVVVVVEWCATIDDARVCAWHMPVRKHCVVRTTRPSSSPVVVARRRDAHLYKYLCDVVEVPLDDDDDDDDDDGGRRRAPRASATDDVERIERYQRVR